MFLRFPAPSSDFTRSGEVKTYPKTLIFRCAHDKMSARASGGHKGAGRERRDGLTARRPVLLAAIFALSTLLWAGPAVAASPQRIYKDLADNGRLDGNYSRADIARALNLQQVVKTDRSLSPPAARRTAAVPAASTAKASTGRVPFTGLDVVLLLVGGGPLLLIGVGIRRRLALTEPVEMIGS
jgi:hypothetical protein